MWKSRAANNEIKLFKDSVLLIKNYIICSMKCTGHAKKKKKIMSQVRCRVMETICRRHSSQCDF